MRRRTLVAAAVAALVVAGAVPAWAAVAYTPPCTANTDGCRQQRIVALESHVAALESRVAALETPAPSPSPSVTASATPPPSPTTTPPPAPTGTAAAWPDASNTGVPDGTTLTDYTGPCVITTPATVIDAKTVNCDLTIRAAGVVISRSRVNGQIDGEEGTGSSFRVEDSEVVNPARQWCQCVGSDNFTVLRSEIVGGNRGVYCRSHCDVEDSYIHGTVLLTGQHASALRVEQYATVRHNTLWCEYTGTTANDTGCSADLTGYPDFAPITHNTVDNNLFMDNQVTVGYCAYGGGTAGKPYSGDPANATYIVFTDNVWQRGADGTCGAYGPITDFIEGRTGNQWSGNRFADGTPIPAA